MLTHAEFEYSDSYFEDQLDGLLLKKKVAKTSTLIR